jgi:hypothetical protein
MVFLLHNELMKDKEIYLIDEPRKKFRKRLYQLK